MAKDKPVEPTLAEQAQSLPNPPDLPLVRTFEVHHIAPGLTPAIVEAHSIELAGNGALLFFDYENQMNDKTGRWGIVGRMRRAFAPGQWLDVKETMLPTRHEVTN